MAGYDNVREKSNSGHLLSGGELARPSILAREAWDTNQGSVRDLILGSASKLQYARSTEQEARSKVASMRRVLQDARIEHAKSELRDRRRAEAAAYRATLDRDKPNLADVQRMDEDEVVGMAVRFVQRLVALEPESSKRSWYRLFKHMDEHGSGRIALTELVEMVRTELRLKPREVPDAKLKSLWAALDEDASGFIVAGEFGRFIKKGEAAVRALRPQMAWKERVALTRRLEAAEVAAALIKEKGAMAGMRAADDEQVHAAHCALRTAHCTLRTAHCARPLSASIHRYLHTSRHWL